MKSASNKSIYAAAMKAAVLKDLHKVLAKVDPELEVYINEQDNKIITKAKNVMTWNQHPDKFFINITRGAK
ncbi:hypothetical protein GUA34_05905 [Streptococcus pyogenes]|nr:hypothetical protein [Streptococcus pyogenes]